MTAPIRILQPSKTRTRWIGGQLINNPLQESPTQIPRWLSDRYPADQWAVVDVLRSAMDRRMLEEIAEADYEQETENHLKALLPYWQGEELVEMHYWYPKEVLELTRWSEPDNQVCASGLARLRGHTIRAFACSLLLATPGVEPDKETLIQMLLSMLHLGSTASEAMGRFLTWRVDTLGREEDRPFFALALAAVAVLSDSGVSPSEQHGLANWIAIEEAQERAYLSNYSNSYDNVPWLFGLSFSNQRNEAWMCLIRMLTDRLCSGPLFELIQNVRPEA